MFFYQQGVCIMTTAFLHFFFLASFCWVLTEAWQSYMAVTGKVRTRLIRKRFLCLGWGKETIHFPKTFYLFFPFSVLELAFSHIVSVYGGLPSACVRFFFFFLFVILIVSVGWLDLPPVSLFVVLLLCFSQAL